MVEQPARSDFYENFWVDADYQLAYAYDSAVRDRYPAIRRVWGEMRLPRRVLDYGCGNGVLTSWMHQNGFGTDDVGLDISQTGVQFAKSKFNQEGLNFYVLDPAADLHAQLGAFDTVVCSHVLEHVPQPERAVAQFLPLAEWFVIEVPLEQCVSERMKSREQRLANPVGHVNFWSRETFRTFLQKCGLIIIRDFRYASAPFSPYNSRVKRAVERSALAVLGTALYGTLLSTHYAVLARRHPDWKTRSAPALRVVS